MTWSASDSPALRPSPPGGRPLKSWRLRMRSLRHRMIRMESAMLARPCPRAVRPRVAQLFRVTLLFSCGLASQFSAWAADAVVSHPVPSGQPAAVRKPATSVAAASARLIVAPPNPGELAAPTSPREAMRRRMEALNAEEQKVRERPAFPQAATNSVPAQVGPGVRGERFSGRGPSRCCQRTPSPCCFPGTPVRISPSTT